QTRVRVTRAELEHMVAPRITEAVAALRRCITSAGLTMGDISRILLVGGTSRIPLIGQVLRTETGRPVAVDAEPKLSIALGAATYRQWQPPASTPPPVPPPPVAAAMPDAPADLAPAASASVPPPRVEQPFGAPPLPAEPGAAAGGPPSDDFFVAPTKPRGGGNRRKPAMIAAAAIVVVALAVVGILIARRKSDSNTSATNPTSASAGSTTATSTAPTTTAATGATVTTTAASTTASSAAATTVAPRPADNGTLQGFSALFPAAVASTAFTDRVATVNPAVQSFRYAAEAYDAVIILALAAVQADDDGIAFAGKINGITRGGTTCTTFAQCRDLIVAGQDPDYDGQSGALEFSGNGEPTVANYSQQVMGANNRIDPTKTTLHTVHGPASADVAEVQPDGDRAGDGTFTIGALLPETGGDSVRGAAELAAFDLAVQDVNDAGGVLGQPVVAIKADSADGSTDTIDASTDTLLAQGVDAIVGPASTDLALKVIDKITSAGVAEIAPSTTFKVLSTQPDHGLFFRTAPSNILEGTGLGDLIAADGAKRVALLTRNDDADNGIADDATAALSAAGVAVVTNQRYEPTTTNFDAQVAAVTAAKPDAIIILAGNESSIILKALVAARSGPSSIPTFATDFSFGDAVGQRFDTGT
ncbi:MAG: ABC transporter substrate-binding protein, partial [Ilumatobacteraceae bacterium]